MFASYAQYSWSNDLQALIHWQFQNAVETNEEALKLF